MFILTKIGPKCYFYKQKADGIDFLYIICSSMFIISNINSKVDSLL